MHTMASLAADLRRAGIRDNDTLLVHSSFKSIGEVCGGAETVVELFISYPGTRGLVVFPTLSFSTVNSESPVFDVRRTPCVTGILPELFRRHPGVKRSLHPTHSLAAFGADAAEFVSGHEQFDTPCAEKSPWGKLRDRNAKILFIGTGIGCNTLLHGVEEWVGVPEMFTPDRQELTVIDDDGRRIPVPSHRHVGAHSRYYAAMRDAFVLGGALRRVTFGDADCDLLEVVPTVNIVTEKLRENPRLFTEEWNRIPREPELQ